MEKHIKTILIISAAVNLILLVAVGWLLLDMGVLKAEVQVKTLENQMNQNTQTLQDVVNFLNQSIQNAKK